ncbi:hypothetical protein Hanom_Chr14g01327041 [Helianthus anomalus]
MNKLQILSSIFISNIRRCRMTVKLMSFVLYVSECYTICPLVLSYFSLTLNNIA